MDSTPSTGNRQVIAAMIGISLPTNGFACRRQSARQPCACQDQTSDMRNGRANASPVRASFTPPQQMARSGQAHTSPVHGPGRGRGARGQAELAEDVGQVPVDRVLAQHQPRGDVRMSDAAGQCLPHHDSVELRLIDYESGKGVGDLHPLPGWIERDCDELRVRGTGLLVWLSWSIRRPLSLRHIPANLAADDT
jgi:hypothetical protein